MWKALESGWYSSPPIIPVYSPGYSDDSKGIFTLWAFSQIFISIPKAALAILDPLFCSYSHVPIK